MLDSIFGGWIQVTLNGISANRKLIEPIINNTKDVMIPVASVLAGVFFIIEAIDKITSERFNYEVLIKLLLKLVVSIAIISNASDWALKFMDFGVTFAATLVGTLTNENVFKASGIVDGLNWFQQMIAVVMLAVPWLISFLVRIAIFALCYGRTIEMGVKSIFAPIGCADIMTGGANSNGFRYIKGLIAIAIQGGLMVIITAVASGIIGSTVYSNLQPKNGLLSLVFLGQYFGIVAAMVGMLGASKGIAKELIG